MATWDGTRKEMERGGSIEPYPPMVSPNQDSSSPIDRILNEAHSSIQALDKETSVLMDKLSPVLNDSDDFNVPNESPEKVNGSTVYNSINEVVDNLQRIHTRINRIIRTLEV